MTDKSTPNSTARAHGWGAARAGQLVGAATAAALLWAGLLVLGIPRIAGFENARDFMIPALLIGALVGLTPLRRPLYAVTALLVVVIAVVAYTPIIEQPFRSSIRADAAPVVASGAVVVLGGDVTADGLLTGQSLDRMLTGVALVKAGAAPLLVVPGNTVDVHGRPVDAWRDQQRLIRLAGVDSSAVLVSRRVHSTRDEAVRARSLLSARGIRRIHVVTSPAHTARACRTFERLGFVVTCAASDSRDVPVAPAALFRSSDRLEAFGWWLYERAATAYYHMKGWV